MRRLVPLIAAVTAVAVAGCGSDEDTASAPATAAPAASAPAATPAPASGTAVAIGMKGLQFGPKAVTIKVGTTVTWTNQEDIPHNVTADSGAKFKSGTFGKGGTFRFKATKAGTIKYECTIHPGMVGTLTVEG